MADFIVNTTTASYQQAPTVTALPDGRLVVTWQSLDDGDGSGHLVRARLFNSDGTAAGEDFVVNTTTFHDQAQPTVTALPDGHFVVTWSSLENGSDGDIRARLFNGDGTAVGDDFVVNTTMTSDQLSPTVTALPDGHFVVTWQSNDGGDGDGHLIRARLLNADGTAAGDDFVVNTTTASDQLSPTVTALPDGHFVVTWRSGDGGDGDGDLIRARMFDADGTAVGDDFVVNTTTASSQVSPSVTALLDGHFVVTWYSDDGGDGDGLLIRARLFSADGTAAGDDFVVNTTTASDQASPTVTTLPDGRFVVTWTSSDNGSDNDIRARLFNADGTATGDDFLINTTTADEQSASTVTALPDGNFVVTWHSADNGLDFDIRAIVIDPAGAGNASPTITSNGGGNTAAVSISENTTAITTVTATDQDVGKIVGYYLDDNTYHGFLYDGGNYTTLDNPAAGSFGGTLPLDINASGQIVGWYSATNSGTHGFLYTGGTYVAIDHPLATNGTIAQGINDAGQITGHYQDSNGVHGFLYSGGAYTTLDHPLATHGTSAEDINATGQVVGSYAVSGTQHGFLYSGGSYTTIDVPGSSNTIAQGINDAGQIVGYYQDFNGIHGFLYSSGVYTTLDDPLGIGATYAFGISNTGQIVGEYFDGFEVHGFLYNGGTYITLDAPSETRGSHAQGVAGGQALTYSLVGGADATLFTINPTTGALAFENAPDFEVKADAGADNVYDVTVEVSDGNGGVDTQAISVTIQNVPGVTLNGTSKADTRTGSGEEDVINGLAGNDTLNGLAGNDTLNGGAGNDRLDGGTGNDAMTGGTENDTYVVDSLGDTVTETAGQGTDTIETTLNSFSLGGVANLENLTFTGAGDFVGTGNALSNTIRGGNGNDRFVATIGDGNDSYVGGNGVDTIDLSGTTAAATVTGSNATSAQIGTDTLSGIENVIGSQGNDQITGTGAANVIDGGNGNDNINAGGGDDRIIGGAGNDTMDGAGGSDNFAFAAGFGNDNINTFDANPSGGQDLLDISAFGITGDNFATRVTIADVGADTLVTIDGDPGQTIRLLGIGNAATVTQADFLL